MSYSIIAKSEDYQAEPGDTIAANTAAGSWTLTLPVNGGEVIVLDQLRSWSEHPLIIDAGNRRIVVSVFDEQADDYVDIDHGRTFETKDFESHLLTLTRGDDGEPAALEPWHCRCKRMVTNAEAREQSRVIAIETEEESRRMKEGERVFLEEQATIISEDEGL